MIYKFTLISDEVDNFRREIQIDPDAKFISLHQAIFKSIKYQPIEDASFFICDDDWEQKEEISLANEDNNPEYDIWPMETTPISEFIEDEGQRLSHIFDLENNRCFYLELTEIITGKEIKTPKCTKTIGDAPDQFLKEEQPQTKNKTIDVDESFYGDSDYDSIEIEGFENLEDL